MTQQKQSTSRQNRFRKGTASIELAVCLPIIVTITFGTLEIANAVYLKQALTAAAYEAALSGTAVNGTQATATANAQAVLTAYGVNSSTISISPTLTTALPSGTTVVATVSAPLGSNGFMFRFFSTGTSLSATVTMCNL